MPHEERDYRSGWGVNVNNTLFKRPSRDLRGIEQNRGVPETQSPWLPLLLFRKQIIEVTKFQHDPGASGTACHQASPGKLCTTPQHYARCRFDIPRGNECRS